MLQPRLNSIFLLWLFYCSTSIALGQNQPNPATKDEQPFLKYLGFIMLDSLGNYDTLIYPIKYVEVKTITFDEQIKEWKSSTRLQQEIYPPYPTHWSLRITSIWLPSEIKLERIRLVRSGQGSYKEYEGMENIIQALQKLAADNYYRYYLLLDLVHPKDRPQELEIQLVK